MTDRSQNGWPVLAETSRLLYTWTVPADTGDFTLRLRRGPAGLLLCHMALRHAERVEGVAGAGDDFGYAHRQIAGSTQWSNHASGTAEDLNASKHPSGTLTFSAEQTALIRDLLALYEEAIRWGGDYLHSVDQMHYEVNTDLAQATAIASKVIGTPRGKRLLDANPSQARWLPAAA